MTNKDLGKLWARFRKFDKDRSGAIDIDEFYNLINDKRSLFGDSIFELIDIDDNGTLDFSEFLQTLGTYCMFGREDIRKFCYYIFDKDKNGYIEQDELTALIDLLHENAQQGNMRTAMEKFDTNGDGKIDFGEFTVMDKQFPMLLFPAYRLQTRMMQNTLGEAWWKSKQALLQGEREKEEEKVAEAKKKEEERLARVKKKEIMRRMGPFQYYVCFWKRAAVQAKIEAKEAKRAAAKKKKLEERAKRREEARKDRQHAGKRNKEKVKEKGRSTADERKKRRDKRRKKESKGGLSPI